MTHLIKLELKKFGIAQNIIFMFAAILFSILFITISLWDSMTDPRSKTHLKAHTLSLAY